MKLKLTKFSLFDFIKKSLLHKSVSISNLLYLLKFWLKGFTTSSILLYELGSDNWKNYLPDSVKHRITLNTNKLFWPALHDKFLFYLFFKDKLPTPKLYAVIQEGTIVSISSNFNIEVLENGLKNGIKYVLKPLQGGMGEGIKFISFLDSDIIINNKKHDQEAFRAFLKELSGYGIFEYCEQHSTLKKLFPNTTQTIRLISFLDDQNNPFIFCGVLRMGCSLSAPFDNFSQGGLVSSIDYKTGKVSNWIARSEKGTRTTGFYHPDSKIDVGEIIIPHWKLIKSEIISFLKEFPLFDYVGWDILVTEEGFVVIEGNHNPGLYITQVHKPLLKDERVFHFFKSKRVI